MADKVERRHVRLLLVDYAGQAIVVDASGALPAFLIELAQGETTIEAASRLLVGPLKISGPVLECFIDQSSAHDDASEAIVPVLIVLAVPSSAWRLPDGCTWQGIADATPAVEPGLALHLANLLDEQRGRKPVPALRSPWSRAGWYTRASEWIERSLVDAGHQPPMTITQVRHWGISAVMRVDTTTGRCWFKAAFPHFHKEAAVTAFLHREARGCTTPVIAANFDEGWLLLEDLGNETVARKPEATRAAIERLAAVQRSLIGRTYELAVAGCRERPLAGLPRELERILASPLVRPWLSVSPRRARQVVTWLADAVAAIDALGVPPTTLVHGDLTATPCGHGTHRGPHEGRSPAVSLRPLTCRHGRTGWGGTVVLS